MLVRAHVTKPAHFNPKVEVAACYIEVDDQLLFLQQSPHKQQPGTWGVPAGKLEPHETAHDAAARELFEETGIELDGRRDLQFIGTLYMQKQDLDYVYHLFEAKLDKIPHVQISEEHQDYTWAGTEAIKKLDCMGGALEALEHYRKWTTKKIEMASM